MRRITVTVAVAALVLLASDVLARADDKEKKDPAKAGIEQFKMWDKNGDGKLTKKEYPGDEKSFEMLDVDKDGFLTPAELYKKRRRAGSGPMLKGIVERKDEVDVVAFDANHDGKISLAEYRLYLFALADQNSDGAIDEAEAEYVASAAVLGAGYEGKADRLMQRMDKNADGKITEPEWKPNEEDFRNHDQDNDGFLTPDEIDSRGTSGVAMLANLSVDTVLEKWDRNKDGALSAGEFPGGAKGPFERADKDKDGKLTRDELNQLLRYAERDSLGSAPPDFVTRYDVNGDKKVSMQEYPGTPESFARLDKNGDGFVSKADQ